MGGRDGTIRAAGTTSSQSQLMNPLCGLLHPPHVLRATDNYQPGEDFLYEDAGLAKRQRRPHSGPPPFGLEKRIGDCADRHVVLPSRVRPSFEVIEDEFGLEVLIVLFDHTADAPTARAAAERPSPAAMPSSACAVQSGQGHVRTGARFRGRAADVASRWRG